MTKFLGLPDLASQHGADVDRLILYMHFLMGALFVGWIAYFIYVLLRFRKSKNPKASYTGARSHASTYVEGAVALVEAVLLVFLAVPMWARVADAFPQEKDSTVMRVIAEQFAWGVRYPGPDGQFGKQDQKLIASNNPLGYDPTDPKGKDDVSALNEIYAPVNKPVIAYISSKDVIHAFKINPFRVTQDAIPGMSIPTHFVPTKTGKYILNCSELCGNSHYFMKAFFTVVTQEEFDTWLKEKGGSGGASGAAGFE